jgi:phosphatidylglycerophosphatase A
MLAIALAWSGCAPAITFGALLFLAIIASLATLILAPWYTAHFKSEDPPQVVCDEVAGQSLALLGMTWLAPGGHMWSWVLLALLAFALFRVLDVLKPGLIGRSQRLPDGLGVLADDVLAGVVAGGVVLIAGSVLSSL